jgi:putative endonuclease
MSKASDLGKQGEDLACEMLRKKGYRIRQRNFRFDRAEVDIIAQQDEMIVFVEVKARETDFLSDPSLLVPMKKQRQIIKAADAYLKESNLDNAGRFDIVVAIINSKGKKLDHLVDAFYPTL